MTQTNINKVLKNNWKVISNQYLLKTILWLTLSISLIIFSILIKVNPDWYNQLLKWDFFNNWLNFIKLFVNISQNITYIFCFTSAITFIFVLLYFTIYFIIDNTLDKNFNYTKRQLRTKWWDNNQQKSTFTILTIEVIYFLVKNILKSSSINIDFDQILKYFIPASSLALIIAVFIQSLVKNNVKKILSNMNNAPIKANDFKVFYKLEGKNVLTNYDFIKDMPNILKNKVNEPESNNQEVLELIEQIYQLVDILQNNKKNKTIKKNEINYLMYHIFYERKTEAELDQISKKITPNRKKV